VKILFYSSIMDYRGTQIRGMLETLVPEDSLEIYGSIEDLTRGIHRLCDHRTIILLRARNREELLRIVSFGDLLQDLRLVLLIPDREEDTISLAHRLRPRFLSNCENNFSDAMNVLRKMLQCEDDKSRHREGKRR